MRLVGVLAVVLAAVLWGTTGTVQSLLPEGRDPLAVGALRLLVGAIALLAIAYAQKYDITKMPDLPWPGIVFAGIAIGFYNLLFFWGVTLAGVGVGTAVTIGSAPVFATLYESLQSNRTPNRMRVFGQGISITGVAMLSTLGSGDRPYLGIVIALLAGACYAAYSLATSRISDKAPTTVIAASTFSIAALVTLPILAFVPLGWALNGSALMGIAFLGVAATGLAYAFYTWGLTYVTASTAVTLALMEPVTAWVLAIYIVGEPVTYESMIGAGLVLAGLVTVTLIPARRKVSPIGS